MQPLRVGIIGFGTVGAGTYEVLSANRELIADRVGSEIVVKRIADLDLESDREPVLEDPALSFSPGTRSCPM